MLKMVLPGFAPYDMLLKAISDPDAARRVGKLKIWQVGVVDRVLDNVCAGIITAHIRID
jgi:hypothetical protein